jgi:DNA-binding NtrC family response regulator
MPHLLIVDDDPSIRETLSDIAADEGFTCAVAGTLRDACLQIGWQQPHAVLLDLTLPDGSGMELFNEVGTAATQVIVMTGDASVDTAVNALRHGATDYLIKPLSADDVRPLLRRVAEQSASVPTRVQSGGNAAPTGMGVGGLVGASPVMLQVYEQLNKVAPTEATVLLIGESGTGKELAALTIHRLSPRARHNFIAVNCGAISPNLIESEMFGHERGSFTGAERQHKGYFERADGGTLFLDEITEMPLELQVKLLRVLENGGFMRVGTNRELRSDVRVLAATNRNPEEAVAEGKLRADLYHRLNVFPIELPPLRARGDDVQIIAQMMLDRLNSEHGSSRRFAPEVLESMSHHSWPGNVRELRNFVQRAYIMSEDDVIRETQVPVTLDATPSAPGTVISVPVGMSLADADRELIFATLEQCAGVKKHAAEILGISLKTLYNRLEEYAAQGDIPRMRSSTAESHDNDESTQSPT